MPALARLMERAVGGRVSSDQSDEKACGGDTSSHKCMSWLGRLAVVQVKEMPGVVHRLPLLQLRATNPQMRGKRSVEVQHAGGD